MNDDKAKKIREALTEMKKLLDGIKETFNPLDDVFQFNDFMMKKTSEYFNEKAAREPQTAEESVSLSKLFAQGLKLGADMDSGRMTPPTAEEEELMVRLGTEGQKLAASGEMEKIEQYAYERAGEFISENPARWRRLQEHSPAIPARVRPFLK